MPATRAPKKPARRRLPDERPQQILDAALHEFGDRGLERARLDDIARRAGLAKGTIYLYFPNKEELFREVVRQTVVGKLDTIARALAEAQDESATDALRRFIVGYFEYARTPVFQTVYRLVHGELHRFPELAEFYATEVILRANGILSAILTRGTERGEFRQIDRRIAGRMLGALVISNALWCGRSAVFPNLAALTEEQVVEQIFDFYLRAIRSDASPSITTLERSS